MSLYAAVWILAVLAAVTALRLGRALFVPLIIGLLLSYVLDPLVSRLVGRGLPRAIAAAVVFISALLGTGVAAYSMRTQASTLIAQLPGAAQEIRKAVEARTGPGPIEKVQEAANELHAISMTDTAGGVQKVQIAPPTFDVAGYLLASSGRAIGLAGDAIVIVFLSFYLLVEGDLFRRHLIEMAGPTLSQKKITLQILHDISSQISAYLFIRALISVFVATATGLALWATGLAQPAAWGVIAGTLNVIPYVGAITATVSIGAAALLQFHSLTVPAIAVSLTALVALCEAYVLTPWLTSRTAEMNASAVFVGLAFW
ncbi:MAG TPA: AI-2E family transporter, partial [Vicinamibacterales bacterium]|nr:AI-2E family transporter [Vicinamibacterales bacterium]